MRQATIAVNDVDMYYERYGNGDPLILLHGAMGTIESCFADLIPRLAADRRVIAVELQGHGHTADVPGRALSYEQLARDVAGFVRALELGPVDVLGYSLGGGVAMQLAMTEPALTRRIVFAGGASYRRDGLHPDMLDVPAEVPDLIGTPWHEAYVRVAPDPGQWATLVAKNVALDRSFEGWTADQVRGVRAPTMLVIGDADIVRPEHTVEMFRLLGGGVNGDLGGVSSSRLAILPGTSHTGVIDRSDWVAAMVVDFLDQPRSVTG